MIWWLFVGCGAEPDPATTAPSDEVDSTVVPTTTSSSRATGDTATPGVEAFTASCALTADNALRAWCDITVSPPHPVEVEFHPVDGGSARTHASEVADSEHRIGLYIMSVDTEYEWTARVPGSTVEVTGRLTTGTPPPDAQLRYQIDGESSADYLLHASPCQNRGVFVVSDPAGELVWYHQVDPGQVVALRHTRDDTLLVAPDGADLVEVTWMGEEVLRIGPSHGLLLHHDSYRATGGLTYALFSERLKEEARQWLVDGFVVFDRAGSVLATWRLVDHLPPAGLDPIHDLDIHHANSIQVEDGVAVVSFRHLSTIAAVSADPAATDFGAVLWALEGNRNEDPWREDFEITASAGAASFTEQHHATLQPDGSLTMFDNRIDKSQPSRGIVVDLDVATGVADISEVYSLPTHCNFQGGFDYTPGGTALVTCGSRGIGYEFERGTDVIAWQGDASCATGTTGFIPRFIPVSP